MRLRPLASILFWIFSLSAITASCTPAPSEAIPLASFTDNHVQVFIYLKQTSERVYSLSATFTPPEGYHLYSKDIAITGINGLGRPTLLELTACDQIKATGSLTESVRAQAPDFEPKELLVYPAGPVTLSLPIELPAGDDWINEELQVTYMACSAKQCKPPVVGKIVPVRIPGADVVDRR